MANLQVKGIDDSLYDQLKRQASMENRSVSQEVVLLIKSHVGSPRSPHALSSPAETLLQLAGSWEDDRPAEAIVDELREARVNSRRFADGL